MSRIIQEIEKQRMTRKVPDFKPGDTVVVQVKVVEGDRERVQAYEGVVIARSNRGLNSSFTVRKISHGEGVERVFQTYSLAISEISVKRRGSVRRAKLYYLRDLSGKAARIEEKIYRDRYDAAFVLVRPVARPGRPAQGPASPRAAGDRCRAGGGAARRRAADPGAGGAAHRSPGGAGRAALGRPGDARGRAGTWGGSRGDAAVGSDRLDPRGRERTACSGRGPRP